MVLNSQGTIFLGSDSSFVNGTHLDIINNTFINCSAEGGSVLATQDNIMYINFRDTIILDSFVASSGAINIYNSKCKQCLFSNVGFLVADQSVKGTFVLLETTLGDFRFENVYVQIVGEQKFARSGLFLYAEQSPEVEITIENFTIVRTGSIGQ